MEAGFKLDTSGTVYGVGPDDRIRFPDLSPFEQGYIEAMFAEASRRFEDDVWDGPAPRALCFSDLAPDTLAAIRKDCAAAAKSQGFYGKLAGHGKLFWRERQRGMLAEGISNEPIFPSLTPYLGDDGLVRLREA